LLFDQAGSAAAFVNIAHAASTGSDILKSWALDLEVNGTRNALAALSGAFLPFGGHRGANLMLMVKVLAVGSRAPIGRWMRRRSTREPDAWLWPVDSAPGTGILFNGIWAAACQSNDPSDADGRPQAGMGTATRNGHLAG